jgi:ammonia channel protein AmtB
MPYCAVSAGFVNIGAAFLFGIIGSMVSAGVQELMERWGSRYVDDTLDVFAVHGVGEFHVGSTWCEASQVQ